MAKVLNEQKLLEGLETRLQILEICLLLEVEGSFILYLTYILTYRENILKVDLKNNKNKSVFI